MYVYAIFLSPALPSFHFRKEPLTKKDFLCISPNDSFFSNIQFLPVLSDHLSANSPNNIKHDSENPKGWSLCAGRAFKGIRR